MLTAKLGEQKAKEMHFCFSWQQWVDERTTPLCYTGIAPLSVLSSVCSVEFQSNIPNSYIPVRPDSKYLHIRNFWLLPNVPNLCS